VTTTWETLLEIAGAQRGFITPADAEEVGVDPVQLRKMTARGRLEHVSHGVYRFTGFPRANHDQLMAAVLWAGRRGFVSHESALDLHELCDVNPRFVHLTVPSPYRPRRRGGELYRIHHERLEPKEMTSVEGIPVVSATTAIRQAARSGSDPNLVEQAIRTARARGVLDLPPEEAVIRRLLVGQG
jgi:predicted transcriptional regulator of viral defense system